MSSLASISGAVGAVDCARRAGSGVNCRGFKGTQQLLAGEPPASPPGKHKGIDKRYASSLITAIAFSASGLTRAPYSSATLLEALPSIARFLTPCKIAAKRKKPNTR